MTAYERLSQHTQLPLLAQPSPLLPDTFNVRWAASPNQVEHILTYPSIRDSMMQGRYGPTGVYTTTQSYEYVQQPQPRIYTHDGYFDSSARPVYHYESAWEREDTQYKQQQQQSAAAESPMWSTSSEWVPAQPISVGAALEPFEQLDNRLATFGSPVTSNALHGHDHDYIMPNLASLTEPITTPNDITSHITQFVHVAHQPIPLSQQSAYSELSVNLQFMERLEREEQAAAAAARRCQSLPAISTSTPPPGVAVAPGPATCVPSSSASSRKQERQILPSSARPARAESVKMSTTATYRAVHISAGAPSSPDLWIPTKLTFVDSTAQTPSPPADASMISGTPTRNTKEPKKPSLACTFCRERKIACGRPPEGSADPTCNQCARRSFTCKYVNEHPRNPRRSRKH